tara:strand:+ start:132 stop:896 length:765 start_codon:yes stop_codon:yes gene_type:complete
MEQLSKTQKAIIAGRSVYHKRVKSVSDGMAKSETVIKKSTNVKLGKKVTRGKLADFPIYTVTLQERATCPASCIHYHDCYGNNMMFAVRYNADADLIAAMESELETLQEKHPKGFLVRLHVLGDFFSVQYVAQWAKWLGMFPALHVYGYTANQFDAPDNKERAIGQAILSLRMACGIRFAVRFSGSYSDSFSALSADDNRALQLLEEKQAFKCPTQINKETGKLAKKGEETLVSDCGACGLCWQASKPVVFLTH